PAWRTLHADTRADVGYRCGSTKLSKSRRFTSPRHERGTGFRCGVTAPGNTGIPSVTAGRCPVSLDLCTDLVYQPPHGRSQQTRENHNRFADHVTPSKPR